jgi:ferredoxin--NADP+ reductase
MSSRLKIAIIGSGPSGFYAAEALLNSDFPIDVHLFDRLPTPFGLVRSGVAPDHPKLKKVITVFEKIAANPAFRFFGNVHVGSDISVESLKKSHHAIIFAIGAETDRALNIPGEQLTGSHTATEFVGWYNGHPAHQHHNFDLSHEKCVIIGQGNVTADVCRILAKNVDELATSDITQDAIDALSKSNIREIHIVGRRGPAQTKFSNKELRELSELEGCEIIIDPIDLQLNQESEVELADKTNKSNILNVKFFRQLSNDKLEGKSKQCYFHFLKSPTEILGNKSVEGIELTINTLSGEPFCQVANASPKSVNLECGLVFRSVGYRGVSLSGVPFDEKKAVIPNIEGRVISEAGHPLDGLYATGWIKRGPSGIIGTNRADSVETVKSLLTDLPELITKKDILIDVDILLREKNPKECKVISYSDWSKIDRLEVERGLSKQKPREKITKIAELLEAAK